MKLFDYECKTTFWQDFTIAEHFGITAIIETCVRAIAEWHNDAVYLTELVMVLNHKIWQWYDGDNSNNGMHTEIARVYSQLWEKAAQYAETHLKGEDLAYYYRVTD